ncbi:tonB-dependent receptor [Coraliomargarita sp. CAG:312]|nr:tonB-dependent receptor [Coraliomargarita sp. CAG:312]
MTFRLFIAAICFAFICPLSSQADGGYFAGGSGAVTAAAEVGNAGKEGSSEDSEERHELEEIVATGYDFKADSLEVPINISKIERGDIEKSSATNLAELLQKKGGVMVRSTDGNANSGEISMRGFGENSQLRVLVIVDGHRLNRSDMGALNLMQIPADNIESIEILRGSHTAEYGNNAVAGVIKIKTLKGVLEDSIGARFACGSYGLFQAAGRFTGHDGDWFYSGEATRYQTDGYRQNSSAWSDSFNLSGGNFVSDSTTVDVGLNYNIDYNQMPGALATFSQAEENPRQSLQDGQWARVNSALATARLTSELSRAQIDAPFGINIRRAEWTWDTKWFDNDQWNVSFNPRVDYEISEDASVYFGADVSFDGISYAGYLNENRSDTVENSDIDMQTFGAYAGGEWEAFEDLTLSGALRGEAARIGGEDVRYDAQTVPKYIYRRGQWILNPLYSNPPKVLSSFDGQKWYGGFAADFGVNYKLDDSQSLFARFDQLYRYPATDEVAAYQGTTMAKPFNVDLKPERGQNYELGYKYCSGEWDFVGNGFVQMLTDEISYDANQALNINLDPTIRYGFDARLSYDAEIWGASFNATVMRAEFRSGKYSGNAVPLVPQYATSATLYIKPLEWITLSATFNYVGPQPQGNDYLNAYRKIPGYCTVDFQALFEVCRYGSVFLAVENAFDKNYVSAAWVGSIYPAIGRVLKAGVNLKF